MAFLSRLPRFTSNDCFLRVIENYPFFLGVMAVFLALVAVFLSAKIHRTAHIFGSVEDIRNRPAAQVEPVIFALLITHKEFRNEYLCHSVKLAG
jgi:hypothetical protein